MTTHQEHLTPFAHSAGNCCFGCGPANTAGLRLEFLLAPDSSVVSFPVVAHAFDGHPGYLHGGIIATLLDEAMSKAVRAQGRASMTRKIEVDYLRPVLSGVPLRIEGRVVRNEQRKHWAEARILNDEDAVLARGKGLFIEVLPKPKS
ncbi:MAG: PaaI family thioesterase [Terracidiphilus sp.]